ncbi:uncharacterized protein LOC126681435 [Mercurialis annua]|uniref:uncharacterized protein LOC126681435 n=1 Tax=Mercurialis annua TaxID=3986 RepID=UPI00215E2CEA|nr:uncharacterized protein LOC126681435 [Mercurialis annua]
MEFSKSIVLLILASFLLSTDAHRSASGPSANSPPSPIHFRQPRPVCKKLFLPQLDLPFKLPKIINPALQSICGVTENPEKCIALVSPCITGSTTSFSALEGVVVSLIEHVQTALSFALKLSLNKSTKAEVVTVLHLCIELYGKVVEDLKTALLALKAHDKLTLKTKLTAAITTIGRCDEAFQQQGLTTNWPLKKINSVLTLLAGFGLDIHGKLNL